jgi:cytochrome c-type biogenesis protein CcmH
VKLYTRLKALVPANSEDSQAIDQVLVEIDAARKGGSAPAIATAPSVAPPTTVAPPKAPAPTSAASVATTAGVEGRVEIDAKLASKVAPGDTLFIFARDPEGSRMPLAVLRGTASELPKSFTLTDAMAMTPNNTISRAKTVVVEARTSKSGNATPQSGDLRGMSAPVPPSASKVRIVIDQVVP